MSEPWLNRDDPFWLRLARAPIKNPLPKLSEAEERTKGLALPAKMASGPLVLMNLHLQVRPCHRCPTLVESFDFLNDDEVICQRCGDDLDRRRGREERQVDGEHFKRRLSITGLQAEVRIRETIGMTPETPDPDLDAAQPRFRVSAMAARRCLPAARRGLLILAGTSGVGKSVAAAWLAWRTHGLFLPRQAWTKVQVRARDSQRLDWLIEHGGVVVLDDAFVVRPGGVPGDSDWESEVVFQVAKARHEANRGTVITTNALRGEIIDAYGSRGEPLLRRADSGQDLSGAPAGGGFVDCSAGLEVER